MATSVSRINVTVGANTQQLTSGMQQAANSVGRFGASAGQAQFAVQQLVFAVDDGLASFGTGGWAGALRGAQNNITAFASSLFGIKGLMIAVASVAAIQLGRSFLNIKSDAEEAKIGLENLDRALKSIESRSLRGRIRGDVLSSVQEVQSGNQSEVESIRKRSRERLASVFAERDELIRKRDTLNTQSLITKEADAYKDLQEQLSAVNDEIKTLTTESRGLLRVVSAADERLVKLREVAPDKPGSIFGFGADLSALGDLARRAKPQRSAFDPFRFFGSLPGANAFGSSGAVSAINQAQIGPRNVEDAQLRKLDSIDRNIATVSRSLGGKLPIAVEVPL